MLRAFIFDMDGTLLDTEILWVEAVERMVHESDLPYTREEALYDVYGVSWHEVADRLKARFSGVVTDEADLYARLYPHYEALKADRDLIIPGSLALLKRLAAAYPVALVSGSRQKDVEKGIELLGIAEHLVFSLNGDMYHPGKPDPVCYRMAAERFNLPPDTCMVFEDSSAGIIAAKDAGMHCAAIAQPGRPAQDLARADLVLADLDDFDPDAYRVKIGV
jgi:HAD superfamily hydrolase (TIGR01509 family)